MDTQIKINPDSHYDFIDRVINGITEKLTIKAKEYVRNNDVFHNFNQGAIFRDKDPRVILYGMMLKHIISINDLIADVENKKREPNVSEWEEKCGDNIIYLILLLSLVNAKYSGIHREFEKTTQPNTTGENN